MLSLIVKYGTLALTKLKGICFCYYLYTSFAYLINQLIFIVRNKLYL